MIQIFENKYNQKKNFNNFPIKKTNFLLYKSINVYNRYKSKKKYILLKYNTITLEKKVIKFFKYVVINKDKRRIYLYFSLITLSLKKKKSKA